jgi:hypothetical protein
VRAVEKSDALATAHAAQGACVLVHVWPVSPTWHRQSIRAAVAVMIPATYWDMGNMTVASARCPCCLPGSQWPREAMRERRLGSA